MGEGDQLERLFGEDKDFEKGKNSLVEGLCAYWAMFKPYLQLAEGMHLLHIEGELSSYGDDDFLASVGLWDLAMNTLITDLKRTTHREQVKDVLAEHKDFLFNIGLKG